MGAVLDALRLGGGLPCVADGSILGTRSRCWCFFFQAEDGIRDYKVTGVQTCALPIWNQLPADGFHWTGNSYDNTTMLSDTTWRHVAFIEQLGHEVKRDRWLMMSDVCKQIGRASCRERV